METNHNFLAFDEDSLYSVTPFQIMVDNFDAILII